MLNKLGLAQLSLSAVLTPDTNGGLVKTDPKFWLPLLSKFPINKFEISFIDDGPLNIENANSLGIRTYLVNDDLSFPKGFKIFKLSI